MFDSNLYPQGLSDQDLESIRYFGVRSALACVHSLAEPTPRGILSSFENLLRKQLDRMKRTGIHGYLALGVHSAFLPKRGLSTVLSELPSFFSGGRVVAVGPVGLLTGDAIEEEAFLEQLLLAKRLKLPVLVHTPTAHKDALTRKTLGLIKKSGLPPSRALVARLNARTVRPVLACGHHAGLTLHPHELTSEKAAALIRKLGGRHLTVGSSAGEGAGDILALPRLAHLLTKMQLSPKLLSRVLEKNAEQLLRISPT